MFNFTRLMMLINEKMHHGSLWNGSIRSLKVLLGFKTFKYWSTHFIPNLNDKESKQYCIFEFKKKMFHRK